MGNSFILEQTKTEGTKRMDNPIKMIHASAPTRICDIGGWTDTWFAKYGNIFSIAVYPIPGSPWTPHLVGMSYFATV